MNLVYEIALGGGLFAVLAFVHFFVDWIFQSHAEAMVKHNNPRVRAKHCLIYTVGFLPLFYFFGFTWWEWLVGANVLFWSHFCEDTYLPVFYWAKWIRCPPEMTKPMSEFKTEGLSVEKAKAAKVAMKLAVKAGFVDFIQTPLGKILMIAIDQIVHLAFLFPIVWMAMHHVVLPATNTALSCDYPPRHVESFIIE